MRKEKLGQKIANPVDDPRLWKVEPGIAVGVLRLGTPRHELLQTLKEHNFEIDEDLRDREFYLEEMDTTLYFGAESTYVLELIEVSDERVRFGTLKILQDYPHNIFATIPSTGTLWFDDLSQISSACDCTVSKDKLTDEQLLDGGTLWITALGVGFALSAGRIISVILCNPSQLPQAGQGEFTGAQRHLSEKMQLKFWKTPVVKTHPLETAIKLSLLVVALLVAGYFGMQAWEEQNRWDNAPEVEAEVLAVWPPPPEPFPTKFQLSYQDGSGETHAVELGQNDVYGVPRVGEHVTIRYLPESPQTFKGPAKLHDIGFERFVPYLLGTFGVYFVLHFFSDYFTGRILHAARANRNSRQAPASEQTPVN